MSAGLQVTGILIRIVMWVLQIYSYVVLAYCILSWFVSPMSKLYRFLASLVDPVLNPIRLLLGKIFRTNGIMRLDFSPIVLMLILEGLSYIMSRLWIYVMF